VLSLSESQSRVGSVIRSIETGWIGKVQSVELHNGYPMFRCLCYACGTEELDDVQWYSPDDVEFVKSCDNEKAEHEHNCKMTEDPHYAASYRKSQQQFQIDLYGIDED